MNTHGRHALNWFCKGILLLGAAIFSTAATCDEQFAGSNAFGGADQAWYNYGFTEYRSDGSTRSFSLNPSTNAHDALETYLSDSVVYP